MAPAAVVMSPIEAAELAYQQADASLLKVNQRVEFFASRRVTLAEEIASLQGQYDRACREAAKGNGADPTSIATEIQAAKAKLHGAELEHKEAVTEAEPLAKTAQQAGLRLSLRRHEDELEALLKTEAEAANAARVSLQKADEAKRSHNAVNYEIGQARKRKEAIELELKNAQ